jgi:hypothetical protein
LRNNKQTKTTKTPASSFDFIEPPDSTQDVRKRRNSFLHPNQNLIIETIKAQTRATDIQNFDSPYHILETNVKARLSNRGS